jgi:subtilisin family serine protease
VFFSQKNSGPGFPINPRALERRAARANVTDMSLYDLPVDSAYTEQLREAGAEIRVISRWLNAASVIADSAVLDRIGRLPFVTKISKVAAYRMPIPQPELNVYAGRGKISAYNYGPSFSQVSMLAVDSLHNAGLSGRNVLIGIMDTGFDTSHVVFRLMAGEHRILATYDFINGDSNVMDLWDSQRSHGTETLSALAGFDEGNLIGPAFGASLILAKTEIISQEIQAEEDYWVAAAEWMESLGADIITSSVGYIDWYDTTQLDGHTAVITRAANIANSLGVIVVNCAGNEGTTVWRKIIPPCDGDSVIAVGAVDINGIITDFSSRGPTADGRIKPDFCAQGQTDYVANYISGYAYLSGTSFSAPLIAVGIALLIEGHPDWTLAQIFRNLKRASSRSNRPDNNYGWGIPNFVDAYYSQSSGQEGNLLITITPHPAIDSVVFNLSIPEIGTAFLSVHDLSGAEIREWEIVTDKPSTVRQVWDGRNNSGKMIASGIYICILKIGAMVSRQKLFYISQ